MKSADYWRRRFALLEESQNKRTNLTKNDIERHFTTAQRALDEQIHAWYGRFADNNQIRLADAKKWLTDKELAELKWDVNEYIKYGKENALNGQWIKQLENASARVHISRLEALKLQTQNAMERLFATQQGAVDRLLKDTYTDGYYKAIYEIQRGEGVGGAFTGINEDALRKVISKPWAADSETFSSRIWAQKDKLIDEIHSQLTQNMILGRPPDAAIKAVSAKLGASRANAGRLIMTESAYILNQAQKDAYGELDVEMIEILGTLDDRTCALCGSFDGKTIKLSELAAGVTAPPFHPWCRCTTIPYFADDDGERIARDLDTGEQYYIPGDMKYEDWFKTYVKQVTPITGPGAGLSSSSPGSTMSTAGSTGSGDPIGQMLKITKGTPITDYEAVLKSNPNYSKGPGWRNNCQRCVPTYELRRRGYDVIAKPRPANNKILTSVDCFDTNLTYTKGKNDLLNQLSTYPDGARFGIRQNWKGTSSGAAGHTYVATRANGKTYFYDPQNADFDCSGYLDKVAKRRGKSTLAYFRMDDVDFKTGLDLNDIVERSI